MRVRGVRRHRAVRAGQVAAVVLTIVGALGTFGGASGAEVSQASFSATAAADLGRGEVTVEPPIVSESLADPGAVTAQAGLDSLGNSTAFAADPFPGTLVGQLPALLAGAVGTPSLPDLVPTVVSSSSPSTPTSHFSLGPVDLRADSQVTRSEGSATDGVNRSRAFVTNDPSTGEVQARAETVVGGIELGGLVSVSGYRSTAQLHRLANGTVKPEVSIEIARITVLGQAFSIGPDGVSLLGTNVPLPGARQLLDTLVSQLAGNGVGLSILEPVVKEDSVVAPGLVLTYATDVPNVGHATVTVTFGRSIATLSSRVLSPLEPDPVGDVPAVSDLGASGGTDGSLGSLGTVNSPAVAPPTIATGAPSRSMTEPAFVGVVDTTPIGRIYPWLFAVGCLLFLSISAHHQLGEKQWTS